MLRIRAGLLVAIVAAATAVQAEQAGAAKKVWNFDNETIDAPPAGFVFGRTGSGQPGRWVVRSEPSAPSTPNVLAQLDTDSTDYRFPVAVVDDTNLRDGHLSVSCKPVSGKVDQACGLVFRYRDENNYYLTRANALEDNVNLYYVKAGRRTQITGWRGKVSSGAWHELSVDASGDRFVVSWNGKQVIDAHDQTFADGGRVGVWTKADSVTYFDNLSVEPKSSEQPEAGRGQ